MTNLLTFLSDDESEPITRMADLFGVWFLPSSVAAVSPLHDLDAMNQM